MKLYVGFEIFDTVIRPDDVNRAIDTFTEAMNKLSDTIESGGVFAGKRGGYMVLNLATEDEAFHALAELVDFGTFEIQPLASFETLGRYLASHRL